MTDDPSPRTRKPAGAAVMQPQVTAAIRTAAFEELADVGYGKLSMEAVARRAGVSKPTLYRRWPGKEQLVLSLVAEVAVDAADTPDTGSLRGDIRAFLEAAAAGLTHPSRPGSSRTCSHRQCARRPSPWPCKPASVRAAASRSSHCWNAPSTGANFPPK